MSQVIATSQTPSSSNPAPTEERYVFPFSEEYGLGRSVLGGKGAELAEMTRLGLPVPSGFTISTVACRQYDPANEQLPDGLWDQVMASMRSLEDDTGRALGDKANPLLVSVRSGAAISMPGMMDTVLNLGMNEQVAEGITRSTADKRFAFDLYRRFVQMFGTVVLGIDNRYFIDTLDELKADRGVDSNIDLTAADFLKLIARFKEIVRREAKREMPEDPYEQLELSIRAVFESWNSRRAIAYRNHRSIPHDLGTAVNVQTMVFGNRGPNSCTGVLFTRNPATGEKGLYGEYLNNAQGEDVVSGEATPTNIDHLAVEMPSIHAKLTTEAESLERHYRDVQDIEFTVEEGTLYLLQTRAGQRSARAAVRIAVEMAEEGLITRKEAVMRVQTDQVNQLLLPSFDEEEKAAAISEGRLLSTGLGASPGAATGELVLDADTAEKMGESGTAVILARPETSAEDVHGMLGAVGVLTNRGGATSHAAVVARGVGKPCVTAAREIDVDIEQRVIRCGDAVIAEGEYISIDGGTGEVFSGRIPTTNPDVTRDQNLTTLLGWADGFKDLGVWANADTPRDAELARKLGAEGVGLCRTEHMFFEPQRLSLVRNMIISGRRAEHGEAGQREKFLDTLDQLEEHQIADFEGIFRAMDGNIVVIRLLDPPLHEFLPKYEDLQSEIDDSSDDEEILAMLETVEELREVNPMMGMRGCRVGLTHPEIYEMQVRAIMKAAGNMAAEGVDVHPEVMVPLVSDEEEMRRLRERIVDVIDNLQQDTEQSIPYKIGAMIETPRAALTGDRIAKHAEFFSFGTNDLTQMTFAFSRDDAAGKFLLNYLADGVLQEDPFAQLDRAGVGKLVETATALGKITRPDIVVGICGEHGGDPSSIEFFHAAGLSYVSCSPFRVPVARLAAAQVKLRIEETVGSGPAGNAEILAEDIMSKDVQIVGLNDLVADAADLLRTKKIGSLVAMKDNQVVGVVTGRDLAVGCMTVGHRPWDCFVFRHMNSRVILGRPKMALLEALHSMVQNNVGHLPIVENGHLVGMVSLTDVVRSIDESGLAA